MICYAWVVRWWGFPRTRPSALWTKLSGGLIPAYKPATRNDEAHVILSQLLSELMVKCKRNHVRTHVELLEIR